MFEWRIFPGRTTLQILQEIQALMTGWNCTPEKFPGRITYIPIYNDIEWRNKSNERVCLANASTVGCYARRFALLHSLFHEPGSETKWNATDMFKPGGEWDRVAKLIMENLRKKGSIHTSCHQCIGPRPIEKQRKLEDYLSIPFCADEATIEAIFALLLQSTAQYSRSSRRFVTQLWNHQSQW